MENVWRSESGGDEGTTWSQELGGEGQVEEGWGGWERRVGG